MRLLKNKKKNACNQLRLTSQVAADGRDGGREGRGESDYLILSRIVESKI